jgi:hypothetical protein
MTKMQRVEMCTFYDVDIHCPFCGQKVLNQGIDGSDPGITVCPHTDFVASDHGFEYRSPAFNAFFNLSSDEIDVDCEELGFEHIDEMTDAFNVVDGVKFAQYVGPPSGLGGYVGFSPAGNE